MPLNITPFEPHACRAHRRGHGIVATARPAAACHVAALASTTHDDGALGASLTMHMSLSVLLCHAGGTDVGIAAISLASTFLWIVARMARCTMVRACS